MTRISRRDLLKGAALAGAAAALTPADALAGRLRTPLGGPAARTAGLGLPSNAPIDTVVVVMMENRSFDHFLGWMPNAAGTQAGLTYIDDEGVSRTTAHFGTGGRNDFVGCGFEDPSHSWAGGRIQLGGEARDASGFAKGDNDAYALSYYKEADLPVWAALTRQGTIFDHYFTGILGPTYPNRYYMHAADAGGRKNNNFPGPTGYPETTIWDRCNQNGITWAYYYSNLPVIGLYGPRMVGPNVRHISSYYDDCAKGNLPQVCFVDPFFVADFGLANDDHPHADIRLGQQFIGDVVRAFASGPQWPRGALFVNYDEWGGFFDTLVPGRVADDRASTNLYEDFGQLGFRCPATVVSPWAQRGVVSSAPVEHTSILKFIEWRYGLPALCTRDANAANIGEGVFDFEGAPNTAELEIPEYKAPPEAFIPCEARGHAAPVSDLWTYMAEQGLAEHLGLRIDYRFEDSYSS